MKDPEVIYRRPFATPTAFILLEPVFARLELAAGVPAPPDPYLRQRSRAELAWRRAEVLRAHAYAKVAIAHELLREARELDATADRWDRIGVALFHFAARLMSRSPWCS